MAEIKTFAATAAENLQQEDAAESTALIGSKVITINDTFYSGWSSRPVVVVEVQLIGLLALGLTVTGLVLHNSFQ